MLFLVTGNLPWNITSTGCKTERDARILELKCRYSTAENIGELVPDIIAPLFESYFKYVSSLSFSDTVNYGMLKNLILKSLSGMKYTLDSPYDWELPNSGN